MISRRAEERWAFQIGLTDALRLCRTACEVQQQACQMLGEHLGVNRVHFADVDGDEFVIRASYVNGVAPFDGRGRVDTFGAALVEAYRRGDAVVVEDVEQDPRFTPAERARLRGLGTAAFAGAMLTRGGRWVASLGVHSAAPRAWTPDDIATLTQVAERVWTATEHALAEMALRESEARYAAIFQQSPVGIALTKWPERITVSANPALLRMIGFAPEEVIGKTSIDLGISTSEAQARVHTSLAANGSLRDFECTRLTRSGDTRVLSLNVDWVSVNGEQHVLTTVRDLTELRAAEQNARAHEQQRLVDEARTTALRHSEAKYSGILQTSADSIVCVDAHQRITLFNEAAERAFGYTRAELIGKPLDILVPERLRAAHREHVARYAAAGQQSRVMSGRKGQLFGRRKDGEEFPIDVTISEVTVDGETTLTAAIRDITAKLRSEVEERLLSEVGGVLASRLDEELALTRLTTLAVREFADISALFLVSESGAVQRHGVMCRNPERQWFCDLLMGLPVDRRDIHPLWQILDSRRPLLRQLDAEAATGLAQSPEHRQAIEILRPRSFVGVPVLAGEEVAGALFVMSSWPSRAFDERDLRLMEEIARRAALSLENARLYRAAQQAIQAREDVLSIVAHDLRSPLGTMLLYAGGGIPVNLPALKRAVLHMDRMISDLLEVNRMDSGHLELERAAVAPGALLAEALDAHGARAAAERVELRAEAPPDLPATNADRGRVLQVFENLIGNAMRFSAGRTISLAATATDGAVQFSVADTGSGIAPDDLPHVFDRFWQAKKTKRGTAGLGLAIAKAVVEAHGGRIWLESTLGAGTTVFFTLPIAAEAEPSGLQASL